MITCARCGREFTARKDSQIYCSKACRIAYQKGTKGPAR